MPAETEIDYRGPVQLLRRAKDIAHSVSNMRVLEIGLHENDLCSRSNAAKLWIVTCGNARHVGAVAVEIPRGREIDARHLQAIAAFSHARAAYCLVPDSEDATRKRWMVRIDSGIHNSNHDSLAIQISRIPELRNVNTGRGDIELLLKEA